MCGIVYMHDINGNPVNNGILDQFDAQRSRGTQGFGLFDGQEMNMVHTAKEDRILKWLVNYDSNLIMFHHRFPTSTVNVSRAAHPFSTKDYFGDTQYILVHNGSIRNAEELFTAHQAEGIKYQSFLQDLTFNDSEALLWDFARYMEGEVKEVKAYGAIAFTCVKLVKGNLDKLYFYRNSNPLHMNRTKDGIELSSEGKGDMIVRDTLYTYNYKLNRLTNRHLVISEFKPWARNRDTYGNYSATGPYVYTGGYAGGTYTPGSYAATRGGYYDDGVWVEDDEDLNGGYWDNTGRDWMGPELGSKFARFFDKNGKVLQEPIEYGKDPESQLYLPLGDITDEMLEDLQPTPEEVQTEVMAYLAGVHGHFEQALWAMEGDYGIEQDRQDTMESHRRQILLEKSMEWLNNDPEYEDDESVSSIWESIWHQAVQR